MLRTAAERWPMTQLIVVPIPVQGSVAPAIISTLEALAERTDEWGLEALVLARGGGSREDLAVFRQRGALPSPGELPHPGRDWPGP